MGIRNGHRGYLHRPPPRPLTVNCGDVSDHGNGNNNDDGR